VKRLKDIVKSPPQSAAQIASRSTLGVSRKGQFWDERRIRQRCLIGTSDRLRLLLQEQYR
jgi:hypothetical protein